MVVAHEFEEVATLHLDAHMLHFAMKLEGEIGQEGTVLEVALRLLMHERAHLGGFLAYTLPLLKRLLDGHPVAFPLAAGSCLGVEVLKEVGYQRTHGEQLLQAFIGIDVVLGLEVDVAVLLIQSCIGEGSHLLLHRLRALQPVYTYVLFV